MEHEWARVKNWIEEGRLLPPVLDQKPDLVCLTRAISGWLGDWPVEPVAAGLRELLGEPERVVWILVDGLADCRVGEMPADSFLARHRVDSLLSVVPSSTAPALTSLATGLWPVSHGIFGWFSYAEKVKSIIISMSFMTPTDERSATEIGLRFDEFFGHTHIFSQASQRICGFYPESFCDSPFTVFTAGSAKRKGYGNIAHGFARLRHELRVNRATRLHYLYLPQVDADAHKHGATSDAVWERIHEVDRELTVLANDLPQGVRLIVTADHGMVDWDPARHYVLRPSHPLMKCLQCPPSAEPALPFFHVREGREGEFAERFREWAGADFALLPSVELAESGWLGHVPLSESGRLRMGTFAAVAAEPALVQYAEEGAEPYALVGIHGGMRPEEMLVPLVLF